MIGDVGPTPVAVQRLRQPSVLLVTEVEFGSQFGPILLVMGGMRALIDERFLMRFGARPISGLTLEGSTTSPVK